SGVLLGAGDEDERGQTQKGTVLYGGVAQSARPEY
ncbi:MAG: hypothetical protein RL685_7643, partial [Pseudomonadota bacterium]